MAATKRFDGDVNLKQLLGVWVHSDTQYPDSSNSIRELSYVDQE